MEPSSLSDSSYHKRFISKILVFLITTFTLGSFLLLFVYTRGRATEYQKHSNGSGLWSRAETWTPLGVPAPGDNVEIKSGHSVTYDVDNDQVMGEVSVKGKLSFAPDKNTKLVTRENILVEPAGTLEVGTQETPIHKDVKSQIIFRISQAVADAYVGGMDFNQNDKGLWVRPSENETVNAAALYVHGSPIKRTWTKLTATANKGANKVIVEHDVNDWYVGGEVVIPATTRPDLYTDDPSGGKGKPKKIVENEIRKIVSLTKSGDNTEITLDANLSYTHSGTDPYRGEVALLTRNVFFKTEIEGANEDELKTDVTKRKFAHIHQGHNTKGYVQYGEFKYMGHYATLSRYTLHSHLVGNEGKNHIYRGNGIWMTGFRCINLHAGQGILIEDNVCYDSTTTGYFVEQQGEPNYDYRFIHNFVAGVRNIENVDFDPQDPEGNIVAQELRQASGFWAGVSENAAFLGNVASAENDGGIKSAGYNLTSDGSTDEGGTMPFTFVANESHNIKHGIWSWQNAAKARDLVGTKIWKSGEHGIRWGAYGTPNKYFNTEIRDNVGAGLAVLSVHSFIQDSIIEGKAEGDSENGFQFDAYIQPQPLKYGNWISRNTFRKFQNAITQKHDVCNDLSVEKKVMIRGRCSAIYSIMMSNTFEDVDKAFDFGWQANANNMWRIYDYLGDSFIVLRKDQLAGANQTPLTSRLIITGKSALDTGLDGIKTRLSDLPATVDYGSTLTDEDGRPMPFVLNTVKDLPPVVKNLQVLSYDGKNARVRVEATDDKKVTKVEFLANWEKVGEMSAPTSGNLYEMTINLDQVGKDWPKNKFVYLYVRAFDGAVLEAEKPANNHLQRAYSNVIEVGPEVMGLGGSAPATGGDGDTGPTPTTLPGQPTPTTTQPTPTTIVGTGDDQVAPVILVLRPKKNEILSGSAKLSVRAVDNKGIAKVEFYVDGKFIGNGNKQQNRYVIDLLTKQLTNGNHQLEVKVYDTSGNTSSILVTFTVSN